VKQLTFITLSRSTYRVFEAQLKSFFREQVAIWGACLEDPQQLSEIGGDLILVSSRDVIPVLAGKMTGGQFIVSRRTLDPSKLSSLFKLEAGTEVLVVNNAQDVTEDTVDLLREFGLDSLHLIPWWPGCQKSVKNIKTAVTPGFVSIVPSSITDVYDLGVRPIDVSTLVEIALHLHLPLEGIHYATAANYKGMVKVIREQADLLSEVESSRKELEVILDNVHDAVIMCDSRGTIRKFNNAAELMLRAQDKAGRTNVNEWLPPRLIETVSTTGIAEKNRLCNVGNKKYLVTVTPIQDQGRNLVVTALESASIEDLARAMKSKPRAARYCFEDIVGANAGLKRVVNIARKLASTNTTVFITGETGTGKELFAHAIHNASPRRNGPFVAQNIAALPEQLVQSELFGYESGAFTGARREGKPGLFELADGGTIFLDEIADISMAVQVSLLRVLQEREVTRVGGSNLIPVSVRVIAATNQDLREAVEQGRFRKDLYYRLCVFPLRIPPLRERPGDIPLLVDYFTRKYSHWEPDLPERLMRKLQGWSWPGNVRELEELIRYAASISDTPDDFHAAIEQFLNTFSRISAESTLEPFDEIDRRLRRCAELEEFAKILECLSQCESEHGMGRDAIHAVLTVNGVSMTPGQIRTRMRLLSDLGLAESVRGRNGTKVTSRGRDYLSYLMQKGYLVRK